MWTLVSDSYFQYTIRGHEQLAEALSLIKDLPAEKGLVKAAISKSLVPMRDDARHNSPVAKGNLRDSWFISQRLAKSQKKEISEDAVGVYVGSNDQSAHLIEFGVRAHTVKVQKKRTLRSFGRVIGTEADIPEIPPNPVMKPAFENNKDKALSMLAGEIRKKLFALADRLSKQAGRGRLSAAGKRTLGIK